MPVQNSIEAHLGFVRRWTSTPRTDKLENLSSARARWVCSRATMFCCSCSAPNSSFNKASACCHRKAFAQTSSPAQVVPCKSPMQAKRHVVLKPRDIDQLIGAKSIHNTIAPGCACIKRQLPYTLARRALLRNKCPHRCVVETSPVCSEVRTLEPRA